MCVCIQVYAGVQKNKKRSSLLMELGLQVSVSCWAYVLGTEPGPLAEQVFFKTNNFFKKNFHFTYQAQCPLPPLLLLLLTSPPTNLLSTPQRGHDFPKSSTSLDRIKALPTI